MKLLCMKFREKIEISEDVDRMYDEQFVKTDLWPASHEVTYLAC
jgi:hypothetical protein